MIVSNDDSFASADAILISISQIVEKSFSIGLLCKGVVAHGKFTADFEKSIFFGKPLINAYLLQEDMKLSSIILHHSCESKLSKLIQNDINLMGNGRCFEYLTPMKYGLINHEHLNWLEYYIFISYKEDDKEKILNTYINMFKKMYLEVSGYSRIYIDNTLKYFEKCRQISIEE